MSSTPPPVVTNDPPPMGKTPDRIPKIKVIFKGFIVAEIGARSATIGALLPSIPGGQCHKPNVYIYRITPPNEEGTGDASEDITNKPDQLGGLIIDPTKSFFLSASGPSKVQVFWKDNEPFHRLDMKNDTKDFRWFVDFDKIHNPKLTPIKIAQQYLSPKFMLDRGVFHSNKLSDGDVRIRGKNDPASKSKHFGRFAMEIMVRIVLNPGESASFHQGGAKVFSITGHPKETPRYEIVFDCTCRAANEKASDFDNVYKVITDKEDKTIPDDDQIVLETSLPKEQLTPEVYCSGGHLLRP